MKQATGYILMIRPAGFGFNPETAASNAFQQKPATDAHGLLQQAQQEFDAMVQQLESAGISVWVVNDTTDPIKPDAVFPNNWFSTHADGTLVLYPMQAANRRLERRTDIVDQLRQTHRFIRILDYTDYEKRGIFLEGTGSMVFDRVNKIAYAARSPRTDRALFEAVCTALEYKPISFQAIDATGQPIYHTNVVMSVGAGWVLICLEAIPEESERIKLEETFAATKHQVIPISREQMNQFAGNALLLTNQLAKHIIVLSETAIHCLTEEQRRMLETKAHLLTVSIPTIESVGGGSVRCMMAELFLPNQ
ncbi:MAG TPA: arginine deiminase-related protein [Ferruginibacter sp.]|nr:arginine deiminase-related protein [Ferruginibacter sp.]